MPEKSAADDSNVNADFELKHRIVGAAFLLFFGALFLPWVLGAPGDESDEQASDSITGANASLANKEITTEESLLAAIEAKLPAPSEQVYISKITPLDQQQAKAEQEAALKAKQLAEQKRASQNKNQSQDISKTKVSDPSTATSSEADKAVVKNSSTKPKPSTATSVDARELELLKQLDRETSEIKVADARSTSKTTAQPTTAVENKVIEVGWIVQVGVFTESRGAERVLSDLRAKGFKPSTTIVDTNRGKSTGTRIWLGPYEQRVAAAKAKSRLTSKTGEAGFIRAYP